MNLKKLPMVLVILLAGSQTLTWAQHQRLGDPSPSGPLPDLMIKSINVIDRFKVQVLIANEGGKLVHKFLVFLRIYDSDGQLLKTLRKGGEPPLEKGSTLILHFETEGQTLVGNRFEVEVDVGNINAESNENNNRSRRMDGPRGVIKKEAGAPPATSATVDLAAINIFQSTLGKKNVIEGVIRNLGSETYSGNRRATISLTTLKNGHESQQTLGSAKVPDIAPGGQESITFPSPAGFAQVGAYRLTLDLDGRDGNAANNSKVNTSSEFSSGNASPNVELEAFDVRRFSEDGVRKMKGIVRNADSQPYQGKRQARLYFIDQTGGQETSILIAAGTIKDVAAGEQWEIIGNVPDNLRKVKTYTLKLTISAGDDNSANDKKSQSFVALD